MIYLKEFDSHSSYETEVNGVGVDFKIPNVSYCNDVNDVHFNPYNLIEFYVGEITGTTPQTVKIYTDANNHLDVTVSEGNKWYSYLLPKDKGLFRIEGDSVKKVVVKADISYEGTSSYRNYPIISNSVVEASFKGSNTSNVTNMYKMFDYCRSLTSLDLRNFNTSNVTLMNGMFSNCRSLTSLDLSNFVTSNVTNMDGMFTDCSGLISLDLSGWNTSNVTSMQNIFCGCTSLNIITMKGCSEATINKIKEQLTKDGISIDKVNIITE